MPIACSFRNIQLATLFVAVVSIVTVLLILFFFNYPTVVHDRIIDQMLFKNDTDAIERFRSTAQVKNLRISFYLYNVTNPEQVINKSAKIQLQEIGPFVYNEYKEKQFIDNNQTSGEITYRLLTRYNFLPELSVADPKAVSIYWPNIPLLVAKYHLDQLSPWLRRAAYFVLDELILRSKEPPFMKDTVDNFLFSGSERLLFEKLQKLDPFRLIKPWPLKDNKFGLFYGRNFTWNPTTMRELTASTGFGLKHSYHDLNRIIYFNGTSRTDFWPKQPAHCNKVDGTDGQFFSPFMGEPSHLALYAPDLCRKLSFKLSKPTYISGLPALEYKLDPDDIKSPSKNHNNQCYCVSSPYECALDGIMDLSTCGSGNLFASCSHFALGSPELRARVGGVREPDSSDEPKIFVEPNTGLALKAAVPIQLNVRIQSGGLQIFDFLKDADPLILPFVWTTENSEITEDQASNLKTALLFLDSWLISLVLGAAIFSIMAILVAAAIICFRHNRTIPIATQAETDPLLSSRSSQQAQT